ncbi:MAG: helicase-related protein [Thermoplasmata archaeon]
MPTVSHPRIRPDVLEERAYQASIADAAIRANTLVVLPTGLGKTAIALRVAAEYLLRDPTRSILLMAPTKPLVAQHARSVAQTLFCPPPLVLTGEISPERRQTLLSPPQVVVATPQVIANDLAQGSFPLSTFSLVIFDEAHRAVGDYPYVAIGQALRDADARVLAMTASPGSKLDRVQAVWANLGIEHFELRSATDADVAPYIFGTQVETVEVPLPAEVRQLTVLLRSVVQRQTEILHRMGYFPSQDAGRRELLAVGFTLRREISATRKRGETPDGRVWQAVTAQAVAMKALHGLILAETQGVEALRKYLGGRGEKKNGRVRPSDRTFLSDPDIVELQRKLGSLDVEHPKLAMAVDIVTKEIERNPSARVILFAHYRQTADTLVEQFGHQPNSPVRAARFVGQASHGTDTGLSQKQQVDLLDRFRSGEINCLVATSVGEEGLDIPSTDLVVFYEPVADEVRTIQRRGRTGRFRAGRVIVLITAGTRDVGTFLSARRKEQRMHEMLEKVEAQSRKGPLAPPPRPTVQSTLDELPSP